MKKYSSPKLFKFHSALQLLLILTPLSAFADAIPFTFQASDSGNGRMMFPCSFDKYSSNCFFDSGSNSNQLSYNSKTEDFDSDGSTGFQGYDGVRKSCDSVSMDKLLVGTHVAKDASATRCDDGSSIDTIGINVFNNTAFTLNFQTNQLTTDVPSPSGIALNPLSVLSEGHIEVSVTIGGKSYQALWDTGADSTVIDEDLVKEQPSSFVLLGGGNMTSVTGSSESAKKYHVLNIGVGNTPVPGYILASAIDFSAMKNTFGNQTRIILGRDAITTLNWFIDIPHKKWAILNDSAPATP